ncbi:MAG: LysR family transcriptional regulator, partial [Clostridiales bacterium]|nr:LysR family transcriptional regulator [Clostridiales bacterium]
MSLVSYNETREIADEGKNKMTINQIACFVEAAKAGNISKAAEYLFITQQAASSQIKALEKELGFRVLQRENRGVSLTEEGKILFEDWKDIQERYRISVDRARDYHNKRSKNIRIGLEDMGKCSEDIMRGFVEYERKYSDLHINLNYSRRPDFSIYQTPM